MQRASVSEQSFARARISFIDADGFPGVPGTLSYQIHDVYSGTEITPSTMVTPEIVTTIEITPAENAILDPNNPREVRRLTWTINAGLGNQQTGEKLYDVVNLTRVT